MSSEDMSSGAKRNEQLSASGSTDPSATPEGVIPGLEFGSSAFPQMPGTFPWTPDWWRCLRKGPVSGRYEGEMTGPKPGTQVLDLRVDIDPRYQNSPVMERISGDIYQVYQFKFPGLPTFSWRVYRESWIVDAPTINWSRCQVEITGVVHWWKGIHPKTDIMVRIPWGSFTSAGPAEITFSHSDGTNQRYNCARKSDAFRDLNLEIDVVQSASGGAVLPAYDTHAHSTRPPGLPQRILSVEEAYREAGVNLTIRTERTIIDDSASEFNNWSPGELHDVMETHFSQIRGGWPKWEMWGLLAGRFDNPGVGGIMFDAAAAFGGAGEAPERQGFAVFRNHSWFSNLPAGMPANQAEAEAVRKFLYTWIHEAGHAFNFLHSWDKNRPDSLSWMNYDWRYDNHNGPGSFWNNFELRFDDEELIHLRHGDRAGVIMGGDPWASGGHIEAPPGADYLEAPPGAMSQVEGNPPIELLIRSKGYYTFMEPVEIELRVKNLLPGMPLTVDTQLDPAYGGVIVYLKRPDGSIMEYSPIMCKLATPQLRELQASNGVPGTDRYSERIFLSYGRYGFYFDVPGDYLVRAMYQGPGDVLIPSNMLRIRVGHPSSKDEDRFAYDFFTYAVGMSMYLNGSESPYLQEGMDTLREAADRFKTSMVGTKAATIVAESVARPFFRLEEKDSRRVLRMAHKAQPQEALNLTEPVLSVFKQAKGKEARALNLGYHELVRKRAEYLVTTDQKQQAKKEVSTLRRDLKARGVNAPVLEEIEAYEKSL